MRNMAQLSALTILLAACASTAPSAQLKDARDRYQDARTSEAARLTPDKLYEAKQALDRAEGAHRDDPGSYEEKSLAYVAQRQSELAMTQGRIAQAEIDRQDAIKKYGELQAHLLAQSNLQVQAAEQQLNQKDSALQQNAQQLQTERQARAAAEERARAAMLSLAEVAKVKEEARGTVITLDGAVLFASGQSQLLPIAEKTLSNVAAALKDLDPMNKASIIGFTDSVGSSENNLLLSQRRAESVRAFLVAQGVDSSKLEALGRGEEQPVASNDSPEGRASNRRVEVVIAPQHAASLSSNVVR